MIVQVGDLYDHFSLSRWPHSFNAIKMFPEEEVAEGRAAAEEIWGFFRRTCPRARLVQMMGNHCWRYRMRLEEKLPALAGIVSLEHLWRFPHVQTIADVKKEFVHRGWCFMHGYKPRLGDHARYNQMNTAVGHTHRGGTVTLRIRDKSVTELNAGYLGNPNSKAMDYRKQRWDLWTKGCGWIDDKGARFIPLE